MELSSFISLTVKFYLVLVSPFTGAQGLDSLGPLGPLAFNSFWEGGKCYAHRTYGRTANYKVACTLVKVHVSALGLAMGFLWP